MFEKDGILYAGEPIQGITIKKVTAVRNHTMLVTFSTGETRLFDISPLLSLPAFEPLKDEETFGRFTLDHGIITWCDGAIDIAPERVYEYSYQYELSA